ELRVLVVVPDLRMRRLHDVPPRGDEVVHLRAGLVGVHLVAEEGQHVGATGVPLRQGQREGPQGVDAVAAVVLDVVRDARAAGAEGQAGGPVGDEGPDRGRREGGVGRWPHHLVVHGDGVLVLLPGLETGDEDEGVVVALAAEGRGGRAAPRCRGTALRCVTWSPGGSAEKPTPPMPPISSPPGIAGAAFSGLSAMTASVVRKSPAMEPAFCSALRVTLAGSMMPSAIMSTYSPVAALSPSPAGRLPTFSATTPPLKPALTAICFSGACAATRSMFAPVASSSSSCSLSKAALVAWSSATPPPATMPSSTAALALRTASSMRCLRSLSSTSVAAPARMTATPPASLARRSWSFSRS